MFSNQVQHDLVVWQAGAGSLVHIESLGRTALGKPLLAARVGYPSAAAKPGVLVVFGQHADEPDGVSAGMGLIYNLIKAYGREPDVTRLLRQGEVWVVPQLNPDGMDHGRGWRKNRRPLPEGGVGVDLGFNWGVGWNALNGGPGVFSERETRAVREFVVSHPTLGAFVDYHTCGEPRLRVPADATLPMDDPTVAANTPGGAVDWAYGARGLPSVEMHEKPGGHDRLVAGCRRIVLALLGELVPSAPKDGI